jgi:hypothetical protein
MSGFSEDWLDFREPVDHRSRDLRLPGLLAFHMRGRPARILDLGAGTGSNLRALAPFLGPEQEWTLYDHDVKLLQAALRKLNAKRGAAWETMIEDNRVQITPRQRNLAQGLSLDELQGFSLVTASALFDLYSKEAILALVDSLAELNIGFYTALTYNGAQTWEPPHPADKAMLRAFLMHQKRDKGLGPAAGPDATTFLAEAFAAKGYVVETADSPWVLDQADSQVLQMLALGMLQAVQETGEVPRDVMAQWLAFERTGATVGHTDLLAWPDKSGREGPPL